MSPVILLVEDNPVTVTKVTAILQEEGFCVLEAATGKAAIEVVGTRRPDLVLLDLYLPDMHGFDLLTRLKLRFGRTEVPILAFSGLLSHADEARALQLGFAGFLPKPVSADLLLQTVRTFLAEPKVKTRPSPDRRCILLSDDSEVSLNFLEHQLKQMGFEVMVAHDGEEALQVARRRAPDAIVTDAMMPRMDGFRLCQEVRLDPTLSRLPVVIHSVTYNEEADRNLAYAMGADVFVSRDSNSFNDIVEALMASLGRTAPPAVQAVPDANRAHADRLLRQLERQVTMNAYLTRHCAIQTVGLNVVERIASTLRGAHASEALSEEVLVRCVDAVGTSRGALYLLGDDRRLQLRSQVGYGGSVAESMKNFFGHEEWLRHTMEQTDPVILPSADAPTQISQDVLAAFKVNFLLLIPLIGDQPQGILALGSEKGEEDLLVPARAIGIQVGQALTLGAALTRIAESEHRTRLLTDAIVEGLCGVDERGICNFVNAAATSLLGFRADELLGQRLHDVIHGRHADGTDYDWNHCPLFECVTNGKRCRLASETLWRKDGTAVEVEYTVAPILERGRNNGAVMSFVDITEKKRAQQAMLEWERFSTITGDLLCIIDTSGRLRRLNQAWERVLGYCAEDFSGISLLSMVYEKDHESTRREWENVLAGSATPMFENRVVAKDGRVRWFQWNIVPYLQEGLVFAAARDVTASREANERLRRAEEQQALILRSLPIVAYTMRCNETCTEFQPTWVSENVERVTGFTADQFKAPLFWASQLHREDRSRVLEEISRLPDKGEITAECRWTCADNRPHWFVNKLALVRDADGRAEMVGTCMDISETKHLEAQLRQSQKMDSLGVLAGGVAHDFNNLLTAIHGYSELLLMNTDRDDERREYIEEINKAGERAAGLTRQLLTFSRRDIPEMRDLSLNDAVHNMEKILQRTIGEDIQLITRLHPQAAIIHSDLGQIEQVILNLAVNARDAMPKGGSVTIQTGNVEVNDSLEVEPGSYVLLSVSDTGCGIPHELLTQIFEPFFTTKDTGRGTGLGLSTVYGIVRLSNGTITVDSEVGHGTTFYIYFPLVRASTEAASTKVARATAWKGGQETILLVEDDEHVRALARRVLESCGYKLLEARDGLEALHLFENQSDIGLVLTDTIMPKMSGRELVEHLRELENNVKVLYMSGYTDDAMTRQGLELHSIDFLQKPFTPEKLTRKVREVLDNAS